MRTLFAGILTLALGWTSASEGKPLSNFVVGNWQAGAFSNDQTGKFSHCAAHTAYRSNILMFVSIDRDYNWFLAFYSQEWSLVPGSQFPLRLRFECS